MKVGSLTKTTSWSLCVLASMVNNSSAFAPIRLGMVTKTGIESYKHNNPRISGATLLRSWMNDGNKGNKVDGNSSYDNSDSYYSQMEKEVIASANAKLDVNRVKNVLLSDKDTSRNSNGGEFDEQMQPSQWSVALASGSMTALLSFILFHQPVISVFFFLIVTYVASKDPLQGNDGLVEGDDISGPIARIVGRATIKSIETSKPKVKAVARAAIFGDDEIKVLRERLQELEIENSQMKRWIQRRNAIDDMAKYYSLDYLKDMARNNGIVMEGNKAQLMMRLMEAGILKL